MAPPKNRPVAPTSRNRGTQKCGRSEGHGAYPVSRTGTAGAGSNGSGVGNATGAPAGSAAAWRSSQPPAVSVA